VDADGYPGTTRIFGGLRVESLILENC
jgi:hypothetical protein